MDVWTRGRVDRSTCGRVDLLTCGPVDLWTCGPVELMALHCVLEMTNCFWHKFVPQCVNYVLNSFNHD